MIFSLYDPMTNLHTLTPEIVERVLVESSRIFQEYCRLSVQPSFSRETFQSRMRHEYPFLSSSFSSILTMACSSQFDLPRLRFMLQTALRVRQGELSQHDADVAVGQVLVDQIVKPQLREQKPDEGPTQ